MSRILVALLVLATCATAGVLGFGGAIADVPEMNVSAPGQAAPGEEVAIEFRLENTGDTPRGYVLNASIPESWSVVNQTSDGAVWNAAEHKWAWMTVRPDSVVTTFLTVAVPEDATGSYTIGAHTRDAEDRQTTSSSKVAIKTNGQDSSDSSDDDGGGNGDNSEGDGDGGGDGDSSEGDGDGGGNGDSSDGDSGGGGNGDSSDGDSGGGGDNDSRGDNLGIIGILVAAGLTGSGYLVYRFRSGDEDEASDVWNKS